MFKTMLDQLYGAVPAEYGDPTQPPTIYLVPEELTNLDHNPRRQHIPVAVYLGRPVPHHHPPGIRRLQKYKWCCLRQLISRHSRFLDRERTSALLDGCFGSMKGLVPRIHASYSEEMSMDLGNGDNQVAQLILEDGCFILHRLLKHARRWRQRSL
jgi:hypothetical protein